jgi:hypothetical protein
MKSKMLLTGALVLAASVAVAEPVRAHGSHSDLWPLYGLTGLILLDAYSHEHHHHKHHYYSEPGYRYERRHYSYGHPGKYRHRHEKHGRYRHR